MDLYLLNFQFIVQFVAYHCIVSWLCLGKLLHEYLQKKKIRKIERNEVLSSKLKSTYVPQLLETLNKRASIQFKFIR